MKLGVGVGGGVVVRMGMVVGVRMGVRVGVAIILILHYCAVSFGVDFNKYALEICLKSL